MLRHIAALPIATVVLTGGIALASLVSIQAPRSLMAPTTGTPTVPNTSPILVATVVPAATDTPAPTPTLPNTHPRPDVTGVPAATDTATPVPTMVTVLPRLTPTSTTTLAPRTQYATMLRSQLLRAQPTARSRSGPLVHSGERVVPQGRVQQGWRYVTATHHRRGWVLARNIGLVVPRSR